MLWIIFVYFFPSRLEIIQQIKKQKQKRKELKNLFVGFCCSGSWVCVGIAVTVLSSFFSLIVNNFKQWVPHNRTGEVLIPVLTCFCLFFFSVSPFFHSRSITLNASWPQATRGSGGPHIKVTGMLVVSLRDVNCRFWSHSAWLTLVS